MKCKECKGIDQCHQQDKGYIWEQGNVRCEVPMRGGYNDKLILRDKFKTFECDNYEEIRKHINKNHHIYLHSAYGLGKTHYCYFLANKYNLKGFSVYVSLFADISRQVKQEISLRKQGVYEESLMNQMMNVDMLFMDDLGNEKMTEYVGELLQVVIDYRYKNEKPTFITSNYSLKELYEIYSSSIGGTKAGQLVSRIKTFGDIELKGKNWRIG